MKFKIYYFINREERNITIWAKDYNEAIETFWDMMEEEEGVIFSYIV